MICALAITPLIPAPLPAAARSTEDLAATCTVTSTADSGSGTLRECLSSANSGDTILFDPVVFPPASPATISLATLLPILDDGDVTIDASNAGVILDGAGGSERVDDGFLIRSSGNTVRGLHLRFFDGDGFDIGPGADENIIGGDRTVGSGPSGQGNIVTQVTDAAIQIDSNGNVVVGNYLGTANGVTADGNKYGVLLRNGASGNTIGGATPALRNLISGNYDDGISIVSGASNNVVIGNYIGTNAAGTQRLANGNNGVALRSGASNNRIGGASPAPWGGCSGECNLVSGNEGDGIALRDGGTNQNEIQGNYVGTDVTGSVGIGNGDGADGISLRSGPANNLIGGALPGQGNLASANGDNGVKLDSASDNKVYGNRIGTNAAGLAALGNVEDGVALQGGSEGNQIGGAGAGEGNLLSGNQEAGVRLSGGGAQNNVVLNNIVGLDASGAAALPNLTHGIKVEQGAHDNVIGPLNQVAFNLMNGVLVDQAGSVHNRITANSIYSNTAAGIQNANGGNTELAPPVITLVTDGESVAGTACAGCIVELFSDADGQGRMYEGTATAGSDGTFAFVATCGLTGPNLSATATDASGNTSMFSAPAAGHGSESACVYLPAVFG